MNRLCMGCMQEYDDRFDRCPHCGYAFNTPPKQSYHIEPGSILEGRYIVGKVLGFGGFGVTYLGWDYLMERKVAIKEYLPSEFATRMPTQQKVTVYSGDKEEQFKEGLRKTLDEARRLAKFETVPGIVQIYDCIEANGTSYIVMEFLEGVSLKEYLAEHGKMTAEQAIPVILQIASAMEEVHKAGILHRDIAPDNIYVLNPDEPDALQVKLLDFGAARYATTKHSKSLSVIIKPGYAPEEQYRSRGDQGTWTDVYALAATFYKMLTDVTPEDAMERSVKDEVKRPSKMGIRIGKPVETALMNAMNVKIQDRTQTMEEFSQELQAAEVKERKRTKDKTDVGSVPRWVFVTAGGAIVAVAVAAALMITGVIQFRIRSDSATLEADIVRVPNVINHLADEAEIILEEHDLGMSREKMVYSKEIPQDMVSYQEIKENTAVEKYTTLVVWISMGEEKGVVPTIKGLSQEKAEELLKEAGFTNIHIEESQDPGVYLSVLDISQEQGAQVPLDEEIILTICMNEESQKGDASSKVTMPDIQELTKEEAEEILTEAGLQVGWIEEDSDKPKGTVLGQETAAGTEVNKGSIVQVRISNGVKKMYMPSVLLLTEQEARELLESKGLIVSNVQHAYSDSHEAGKVMDQSIALDAEVKEGDKVTLTISLGKDPAKETRSAQPRQTQAPATQAPVQTQPQTPAPTQPPTEAPTMPPTEAPTQPPTEAPTQPPTTAAPETTTGNPSPLPWM